MNHQRGQSMVEFAVGASVVALLLLGTVTIGGLQEVQRRGIVAAREAAFFGTWVGQRVGNAALRNQLAGAHFDDAGLENATGRARLAGKGDVSLTASTMGAPGRSAAAVQTLITPLQVAGGFLGGGFDLRDSGYRTGVLRTQISGTAGLPTPFDNLRLRFDQPYALLGDAWASGSPLQVERRAGGLVPSHALTSLSALWRPFTAALGLLEPSLRQLCLGLIEPDRVPEDRLGPGPRQGPARC
jgi:hypothetical protein